MTDSARGIWAMVWACLIWGLSPLYYKLLSHIAPIEVLAHRTLWSFGFFALVLLGQNRLGQLWAAMASPRALVVLGVAALMISTNWFVFILSIQIGHATEASLGYYLFPLVAVALGRVVFKERLDMGQKTAVSLAMLAVVVLSLGLGVAPWVALILSSSFGLYGLIKKRLNTGRLYLSLPRCCCYAPLPWACYIGATAAAQAFLARIFLTARCWLFPVF